MSLLAPCSSCSRHVRVIESACPFCGARITPEAPSIRGIGAQHLSRAALFTFGAVALATTGVGCGTSSQPDDAGTDAYYGSIGDVYGAPPHDAWADDAGQDGGLAATYGAPPFDADVDSGTHALYGSPPLPSPPPEQP